MRRSGDSSVSGRVVIEKRLHSKDWKLAAESKVKREKNLEELRKANNERVLKGLAEDFMEAVVEDGDCRKRE